MRTISLSDFLEHHSKNKNSKEDPIAQNKEVLVALLQIIHVAKKWDHTFFPNGIMQDDVSLNVDEQNHVKSAVITPDDDTLATQKNTNATSTVIIPSLSNILWVTMCSLLDEAHESSHWLQNFVLLKNATAQERQITGAYLQLMLVHFLWRHHVKGTQDVKDFSDHLAKENFPITTQAYAEYIYQLMRMPGVTPCTFGTAWIEIIATIEKYLGSGDSTQKNKAEECIKFLNSTLFATPGIRKKQALESAQTTLQEMLAAPKPTQSNNGSGLFDMARAVGPTQYDPTKPHQSSSATAAATHRDPTGDMTQPQHHPATESTAATPC